MISGKTNKCEGQRESIDFPGPIVVSFKTFTGAPFPGILFSLFYHLGTSCYMFWFFVEPLYNRIPRWFLHPYIFAVQNSGINIFSFSNKGKEISWPFF